MNHMGVAAHARARPEDVAIVAGELRMTFAELDRAANRVARALRAAGVGPGDRIGMSLRNRPEVFELLTGAARARAEIVPIPWRAQRDEIAYMVDDSDIRLVLTEPDVPTAGRSFSIGGAWETARDSETDDPFDAAPEPAAPVIRFYTSGTTGRPKAVERLRPDLDAYLASVETHLDLFGVRAPDDLHLVCGPLYHSAPLTFASYALLCGQRIVLMEGFDARACLGTIERERPTWTFMVPIHFVRILALPRAERERTDLSSIRRVLHAGAPCPPDVKSQILELFGGDVVWEFYGMTEGRATVISAEEWRRKPGSVGRPMPGVAVTIRDEIGRALPPGETGYVYVRTGAPFTYAGAPEKTADAWIGDGFTVGDMGYVDPDGYLFLTDRSVDVVISGGANVYPAEVEAVLHRHPAVADCAVIGVPDDEWGESVKAIVEARAPVSGEELIAFCRDRLAHYKCPRTVELIETLPRDPAGKVRKRDLRAPYWAGRAQGI